jgi:DNA-binding NtrC family response regulator
MSQADIECAISSEANVLISGGDPAARTALAQLIHERSTGRQRSLLVVGGARPIQRSQPEDEEPSFVSGAAGRTLFIEELATLDEAAQDELMRLLDSGADLCTNGARDTRIIAATAHNLLGRMVSQLFNAALFYRLNIIHIVIADDPRRRAKSSTIH